MRTYNRKDVFSWSNAEEATINTWGYFGESLKDLKREIKEGHEHKLLSIDSEDSYCFKYVENDRRISCPFFLPTNKVINEEEPKKYRPYKNVDEFCEHHELGDFIHVRRKDEQKSFGCMMFTGYQHIDAEIECPDVIYLGGSFYSLNGLFDSYEFENADGEFVPFGVEE